jgi:hypothetical protein
MKRVACLLACTAACDAGLDQRLSIITEPRLLAVVARPAEALPDTMISYEAVVAGPAGPLTVSPSWAFCTAPKPPTEDNAVAPGCLANESLALGTAPTIDTMLPANGCLLYGPDTIADGFRPRDADGTGGYYQPIRAEVMAEDTHLLGFGLSRIKCKLPNAPGPVTQDYLQRYVPNANPMLAAITIDGATPTSVPARTTVTLSAAWPAETVETYLYYDPSTQTLVERREAMRVSWFATGGTLDVDASAVDEADDATSVSTTWHTPDPGKAWLWFVLRDSRGGIDTRALELTVAGP